MLYKVLNKPHYRGLLLHNRLSKTYNGALYLWAPNTFVCWLFVANMHFHMLNILISDMLSRYNVQFAAAEFLLFCVKGCLGVIRALHSASLGIKWFSSTSTLEWQSKSWSAATPTLTRFHFRPYKHTWKSMSGDQDRRQVLQLVD